MSRRLFLLGFCALALTACGGGGSSTSTSTPPPPTPPAATLPTTGEQKPDSSSVFYAVSQSLTLQGTAQTLMGGTTSDRSVTALLPAFGLTYDASTHTYVVKDEVRSATFGASSFTKEYSVPDYTPRVEYDLSTPGVSADFLVMFKQSNSNPAINTNYAAYGVWQHNQIGATSTAVRLDYFTYGTPTPVSSMPHSGVVTYRYNGTGNFAQDSNLYADSGYSTLTVDFTNGTVTGAYGASGTDFLQGFTGGLFGFRYSGKINGNISEGPISSDIATYTGFFHVTFYGPNAEDIGVVYSGGSSAETFSGAAVGVAP